MTRPSSRAKKYTKPIIDPAERLEELMALLIEKERLDLRYQMFPSEPSPPKFSLKPRMEYRHDSRGFKTENPAGLTERTESWLLAAGFMYAGFLVFVGCSIGVYLSVHPGVLVFLVCGGLIVLLVVAALSNHWLVCTMQWHNDMRDYVARREESRRKYPHHEEATKLYQSCVAVNELVHALRIAREKGDLQQQHVLSEEEDRYMFKAISQYRAYVLAAISAFHKRRLFKEPLQSLASVMPDDLDPANEMRLTAVRHLAETGSLPEERDSMRQLEDFEQRLAASKKTKRR